MFITNSWESAEANLEFQPIDVRRQYQSAYDKDQFDKTFPKKLIV